MTHSSTPAGWYPDPMSPGGLRWWDGFGWTGHAAQPAGSDVTGTAAASTGAAFGGPGMPASPQRGRPARRALVVGGAVTAAVVVGALVWTGIAAALGAVATAVAAPQPSEDVARALPFDESMEYSGWWTAIEGELYVRAMAPGTWDCDEYDCVGFEVYTVSGCPTLLYLEGMVLRGEEVVDQTQELLDPVDAQTTVAVVLDMRDEQGDWIEISEAMCY